MTFDEALDQVRELLQRRGRVTYRSLKLRYQLDDELLVGITDELIKAERVAAEEDGNVLVWLGESGEREERSEERARAVQESGVAARSTLDAPRTEGERRQLTVLFCDMVGFTELANRVDPEVLQGIIRSYEDACAVCITRYEGYVFQRLGDGIVAFFGYPLAHEGEAERAIHAGLAIIESLSTLAVPEVGRLHVRIGIATGVVVVAGAEKGAVGETMNLASRLQGIAPVDSIVVSERVRRLAGGVFAYTDLGEQRLKGIAQPTRAYRIAGVSHAASRFEAATQAGLTPLVGREHEIAMLLERWQLAQDGEGQVVLLSGEPGIGKSRLVQEFKEQLAHEGVTRIEFRCSPYHQNSALYPIIDHLQRLLQFAREDSPATKLEKLQHTLSHYRFPQADILPLLAALLSLPHPEGYPPITLSLQKRKQKTQEALVAWIVEETEKVPVFCVWEDLHWADPSTLEMLTLFLDQVPTARLLALLTFRPEFTSPWGNRAHLGQITLSRLGRGQVEAMVGHIVTQALRPSTSSGRTEPSLRGAILPVRAEPVEARAVPPPEVIQQIVSKTDGVPLFVEELTKSVVESGLSVGATGRSPLQSFAIPTTLHDSLMARLDRLGAAKEIAQVGATMGREFDYTLLQAVSPLDEATLQHGLRRLVEAELVYQRGLPPQATYLFKHALIQDTAYQSLLKSRRQQLHQQIAQVLEERFPETQETQPELVAHHYTEAGLIAQAIPYWQQAGQRATQRSANVEAISHLTKGLELLKTQSNIPNRAQQELMLQIALSAPLIATKGYTAPEVEQAWTRARELCRRLGETPQLWWVLGGLSGFYQMRGEMQTARELAEQCLCLAQRIHSSTPLIWAHNQLGQTLFLLGEFVLAHNHMEQGIALYNPQEHSPLVSGTIPQDPGVSCLCYAAFALWRLGYPDQALKRVQETLTLAQKLSHPYSLAYAFRFAASLHQCRRERPAAQGWAERTIALSTEQGFPFWLALGTILRGWALTEQGQIEEGLVQMRQGLTAYEATGSELGRSSYLALLAEAYGKVGQVEGGLALLAEALAAVDKTGERHYEAELYRLKGELTLQSRVRKP